MAKKSKNKNSNKSNTKFIIVMIVLFLVIAVAIYYNNTYQKKVLENKDLAASVNGEAISMQELDAQYDRVPKEMQTVFSKNDLLSQMVDRKLLLQQALKNQVVVTDDEVLVMLDQIKTQLPEDKTLEVVLAEEKITLEELKNEIENQLIISKFLQDYIVNTVVVTDAEIEDYAKVNFDGVELNNETFMQVKKYVELQKQKAAFEEYINKTKSESNIQIFFGTKQVEETVKVIEKLDETNNIDNKTDDNTESSTSSDSGIIVNVTLEPENKQSLAECLNNKNAALFGSQSCVFCEKQLAIFNEEASKILFVECSDSDGFLKQECKDLGIEAYPTWSIDGKLYKGLRNEAQLKEISGC